MTHSSLALFEKKIAQFVWRKALNWDDFCGSVEIVGWMWLTLD
jgi:hypothetical protein